MASTRREFLKKAAYIAPVILTMQVAPSIASVGSGRVKRSKGNEGLGNYYDPPPPGHVENCNDYEYQSPGNPGKCGPR